VSEQYIDSIMYGVTIKEQWFCGKYNRFWNSYFSALLCWTIFT